MKTLHKLITLSFLKPFFYTFSITTFILLIQYFWKYLDDLIGKGLDTNLILEIVFYSSTNLVPIVLPLSILLSSMMTTGKLTENYEFISMKAAGISFFQIIKPLLLIISIISCLSLLFSNYIIPYSNLKSTTLMHDIIKKKLAFSLEEGVFFKDIDGFSIKINEKIDDVTFKNITIIDHDKNKNPHGDNSIEQFYVADSARIYNNKQNDLLNIKLINGKSYSKTDCIDKNKKKEKLDKKIKDKIINKEEYEIELRKLSQCFLINTFESYKLNFDLSSLSLNRSNTEKFNDKAKTMNITELKYLRDSLEKDIDEKYLKLEERIKWNRKSSLQEKLKIIAKNRHIITLNSKEINSKIKYLNKIKVQLNKKYTDALSCIIMLLIGAPIGIYIKKGGFGFPVIFSTILFLFFYIISTTGQRLVKENILSIETGIWIPIILFFIIGFLMTFFAQKEIKFNR